MTEEPYLFVYGSLLRDLKHPISAILKQNASSVGRGFFFGKLFDLGDYPAAIALNEGSEKVWGEIYRLRNGSKVLAVLDEYEGVGAGFSLPEYTRERIRVYMKNKGLFCWTYLYNGSTDTLTKIEGGDYLVYWKGKFRGK
jgi:gamma-glutamylcyclotransferase (GGCT)/AIG2-like uncharacterized protein YtfP